MVRWVILSSFRVIIEVNPFSFESILLAILRWNKLGSLVEACGRGSWGCSERSGRGGW